MRRIDIGALRSSIILGSAAPTPGPDPSRCVARFHESATMVRGVPGGRPRTVIVPLLVVLALLWPGPAAAVATPSAGVAAAQGMALAGASETRSVKPRATVVARRQTLKSGRIKVTVESNAKRVKLRFRTSSGKTKYVVVRVRGGVGVRSLAPGSKRVYARAMRTPSLRVSPWVKVRTVRVTPESALVPSPPILPAAPSTADGPRVLCRMSDSRLTEISGLAASVRFPGVVWVHNDSGDTARVFAVDVATCVVRAVVSLAGVSAVDFEAISMGRDSAGEPELWVGDVGDNARVRKDVKLYRFLEPLSLVDQSVSVQTVTVTWSDGPRDCESLMVEPLAGGRVFLVSKESTGGVYQLQGDFRGAGSGWTGPRVSSTRSSASDGAIAPDGSRTVVRFYDNATMFMGVPGSTPRNFSLPSQPQGEAITFSPDGRHLYIASEGVGTDLIRIPTSGL